MRARPVEHDGRSGGNEVLITSTAGGILPVTWIDHTAVSDGDPGPVSTRLRTLYWELRDQGWQVIVDDGEGNASRGVESSTACVEIYLGREGTDERA